MDRKIYSDKLISTATFLGGPLVAGYLIAQNYKTFNEPSNIRNTWILAISGTILIFGCLFLPFVEKLPNQLIPFIYTAIIALAVKYLQKKKIEAYISEGGTFHSWGRTIAISLIGVIVTILPVAGIILLTAEIHTVEKTYGITKNEISYDKSNISENEINLLAAAFTQTAFFDDEGTTYVYVEKNNNQYEVSISCLASIVDDRESIDFFRKLRDDVQQFFPGNKITFLLVVDNLDNVVQKLECPEEFKFS